MAKLRTSRRSFLKATGYLFVGCSILPACNDYSDHHQASFTTYDGTFPGGIRKNNVVNSWIELLDNGRVKIYTGKVELGQGIRTAIRQIAAEELNHDIDLIDVQLAETGITPDEGYTAASASVKNSGMSIRYAAAAARNEIEKIAGIELNEPKENMYLSQGQVRSINTSKVISLEDLLKGKQIEAEVTTPIRVKSKESYRYVGKPINRKDIEKMVRGQEVYIQDLRFPDMVHGRVLRPANYDSILYTCDIDKVKNIMPDLVKTVVDGSFIGIVTKEEYQAVRALQLLKEHTSWKPSRPLPTYKKLYDHIRHIAAKPVAIHNQSESDIPTDHELLAISASFTKPYIAHASMGPACGIAIYRDDKLTIWTHSQGIYPLREALSASLKMNKEDIHIISAPGAGCFGHSTADDAATDAAILALAYPNKHIKVQWSREDESKWDPYGSAIVIDIMTTIDQTSGKIQSWKSDVYTDSHSTRPNSDGGTVLGVRYLSDPTLMQSRGYLKGGHRNGQPYYSIPNVQLNACYFDGPLRVSSLRGLGAFANIYAIESMMDRLAEKVDQDPLTFRLQHLNDERAKQVIYKLKNMTETISIAPNEGMGYGFMRYKNSEVYVVVAAKVLVQPSSGQVTLQKMWCAIDVGEVINPDGIKNQTEGGMIQAASWTLREEVRFDETGINSKDWASYPIFRFADVPVVEVAIINQPELAPVGAGEAAIPPTPAAIANAIYRACGKRIDNLPITASKILA